MLRCQKEPKGEVRIDMTKTSLNVENYQRINKQHSSKIKHLTSPLGEP